VHRGKFAEGVGINLGCSGFSSKSQPSHVQDPALSGLCVVACGPGRGCRGADVCRASTRCVGITLNKQGTFATLKAAHEWVRPPHNRTSPWKRLERCRAYVGELAHGDAQLGPEKLGQLQHKWRSQLCSEFNRGAFYPSGFGTEAHSSPRVREHESLHIDGKALGEGPRGLSPPQQAFLPTSSLTWAITRAAIQPSSFARG